MPDSNLADASVLTSTFYNTYIREQVVVTCTSATRPTGVEGRRIYETDTDLEYCHDGTNWILVGGNAGWTSYTPTWTQSATITKTVNYSEYQRGPRRTITWNFLLSATSAGTAANAIVLTLPVTAASASGVVGASGFLDTGTQYYTGIVYGASTTTLGLYTHAGTAAFGVNPAVTVASGDIWYGSVTYEAAS